MMFKILVATIVSCVTAYTILTEPKPLTEYAQTEWDGDLVRGERLFGIAGCAFCHSAPDATEDKALVLGGGRGFPTSYGTYFAPNISSDPEFGIGAWDSLMMINALKRGVSPQGTHYYPMLPYDSFARMDNKDIISILAYIKTLPATQTPSRDHNLPLTFKSRRSIGIWKLLYLRENPVVPTSQQMLRGRYLVEGPGHCAECHTPRNFLGGMKRDLWLSGRFNPEISTYYPNLTPHQDGLADWTIEDIAEYLAEGSGPDNSASHGYMSRVIDSTSQLSERDRMAIAAYLKAIPAVPSQTPSQ